MLTFHSTIVEVVKHYPGIAVLEFRIRLW